MSTQKQAVTSSTAALNHYAELLYGYSASEAVGQNIIHFLIPASNIDIASRVVNHLTVGESWSGHFPLKKKSGEVFPVAVTNTPLYDDDGTFVGVICVSSDARLFGEQSGHPTNSKVSFHGKFGDQRQSSNGTSKSRVECQQSYQVPLTSKISNLASKVTSKVRSRIRICENSVEREGGSGGSHCSDMCYSDVGRLSDHREYPEPTSSGASTPRGGTAHLHSGFSPPSTPFAKFKDKAEHDPRDEGEGKSGIRKTLGSKAEAWMARKGISWHWGGGGEHNGDCKNRFSWPWLHPDREKDSRQRRSEASEYRESHAVNVNRSMLNDAPGSWATNISSMSSNSSSSSTSSSAVQKAEADLDHLQSEVLWEDLTIGEQIGQGSSLYFYWPPLDLGTPWIGFLTISWFRSKNGRVQMIAVGRGQPHSFKGVTGNPLPEVE
eukprot:Gb_21831 [translate_table: standard]